MITLSNKKSDCFLKEPDNIKNIEEKKQDMSATKEDRHRRREERRAKQRATNIIRAEKMHHLRIQSERARDVPALVFPLPKNSDGTQFIIGCSGWFYWRWKGKFYPENLNTKEWFAYYASHFNSVEINASFYSWPTAGTVQTWIKQADKENFIYTVKVCEFITHVKRFEGTKDLIKDFTFIAQLLGPKMGCFLFQLPPSVQYTPELLNQILSQLDHSTRNVVEFRHASWWNEEVYAAFRKNGTIFCSSSGPRLPDQLVHTADDVYVRFHGTKQWYKHNYSEEELNVWINRIRKSGAQRAWIYFNNDYDNYATNNAHLLSSIIKR